MTIPLDAVLDTLGEGVLSVDGDGSTVTVGDGLRDALGAALEAKYRAEIEAWTWPFSLLDAQILGPEDHDGDGTIAVQYVGSVFNLTPSGKVYAPWTTNQTSWDAFRDSIWWEVAEEVASKHGASIQAGMFNDGADVHVIWTIDDDDNPEEEAP